MKEFAYWLLCGADFSLFIFSFVLIFRRKEREFSRSLLGIVFLVLGWYVFMALIVLSGALVAYPFLFRTGVPFYYLAAPLLYIYVRSGCYNETEFRNTDWIHFLPVLFAMIDLFPYVFLESQEFKSAEMMAFAENPAVVVSIGRGILPPWVHYFARAVLGMVYVLCQWWLLFVKSFTGRDNKDVSYETKVVSVLVGFMYIGNSVVSFAMLREVGWIDFDHLSSIYDFSAVLTIIGLVALSLYVFGNPSLLYDERRFSPEAVSEYSFAQDDRSIVSIAERVVEMKPGLSPDLVEDVVPRLEAYMEDSQAYRRKGVTVYDIAKELDIAPNVLSSLLNSYYNQRFNDFVNSYRIKYVTERLKSDDEWRRLSIEGLADDAGFSSRTPFYAAFKRFTGLTPSYYIKEHVKE